MTLIKDYRIVNLDCTVILERPRLQQHIGTIRISLAEACSLPLERISVKAKTAEGLLGEVGHGLAIIAQAVVLMEERHSDELTLPDPWV